MSLIGTCWSFFKMPDHKRLWVLCKKQKNEVYCSQLQVKDYRTSENNWLTGIWGYCINFKCTFHGNLFTILHIHIQNYYQRNSVRTKLVAYTASLAHRFQWSVGISLSIYFALNISLSFNCWQYFMTHCNEAVNLNVYVRSIIKHMRFVFLLRKTTFIKCNFFAFNNQRRPFPEFFKLALFVNNRGLVHYQLQCALHRHMLSYSLFACLHVFVIKWTVIKSNFVQGGSENKTLVVCCFVRKRKTSILMNITSNIRKVIPKLR